MKFYGILKIMINAVTTFTEHPKSNTRYKNIKYSGYISLAGIGTCALTGLKQIKIPHKAKIHKYTGILTAISGLWHLGAIKGWDKLVTE